MKDWRDRVAAAVAVLATVLLLWCCLGCGAVPVELCVDHPTYGRLCVILVDGKVSLAVAMKDKEKLGEAEKSEIEAWIREGGK